MLFDTPVYFVFLASIVFVYWRLDHNKQNVLLLCASYFFYAWWDWRFLGLIMLSTVVDYYCGCWIAASADAVHRRRLLTISLLMNFGFLGIFKYLNFFEDSFIGVLHALGFTEVNRTLVSILLPPGISFYTFQAVAYIVDVHSGRIKPSKSLLDYALFIALFPHLIAGPIQRPSHLLPQVERPRHLQTDEIFHGLMLLASGLFRKCVIADNCALLSDAAFSGKLGPPNLAVLLLGAYAFAWQIYGDFSGYSDMARGSAKLLGFDFMVNFRQPYLATSMQDFWRRWHISLSTWLRDYLYIALGGNRRGEAVTYRNLMLTMVIGGLWHGANWTYAVWGAIHGGMLAIERRTGHQLKRADVGAGRHTLLDPVAWLKRIAVFHLVCLAWVFFRAPSVEQAWHMLAGATVLHWRPEYVTAWIFLAVFTIPLLLIDLSNEARCEDYLCERKPFVYRILIAWALVLATLLFAASTTNAFLYFQF